MTSEVEDEIRLISGGVSEPLVIQELLERLRELEVRQMLMFSLVNGLWEFMAFSHNEIRCFLEQPNVYLGKKH